MSTYKDTNKREFQIADNYHSFCNKESPWKNVIDNGDLLVRMERIEVLMLNVIEMLRLKGECSEKLALEYRKVEDE